MLQVQKLRLDTETEITVTPSEAKQLKVRASVQSSALSSNLELSFSLAPCFESASPVFEPHQERFRLCVS